MYDILMSEHISKTPDPISMKFSQFGHDTLLRNEFAGFYDKSIPSQVASEYTDILTPWPGGGLRSQSAFLSSLVCN